MFEVLSVITRVPDVVFAAVGGILTGATASILFVRKTALSIHEAVGAELRTIIGLSLGFGVAVTIVGFLLDSLDVHPLQGFWTSQPIPIGMLTTTIWGLFLLGTKWVINHEEKAHQETRDLNRKENEITREMLKDHMTEEESLRRQEKSEINRHLEEQKDEIGRRLDEQRALIMILLERK